jgi:hypothetical protein
MLDIPTDPISSDFHSFGYLKKQTGHMRFAADGDVKQTVTAWLQTLDTGFL